ncbi:MAG: ABC transporter permease [Hyphomicrobiales bacterium]|nr:ABC transporter permease [Hyphomicrobiales bacterium]MBV9977712.1 ABC transporter permease [Hyphomicrobiales bacterium]
MPQKSSDALGAALLLAPALLVIAIAFLAPLARLAALSFSSPQGVLAAYRELLGDEVFWIVLRNTIGLAAIVTIITLTGGFALALALTRLGGGWRLALFAAVVLPLWVSVLVRTFSWMLLLERNGPINEAMVATGVIGQPVQLLFNFTGVTIAMVHVLLPYAVLPIYAALVKIDPALLKASEGLGASFATTFQRVLLPLSARGVATAAAFVFLLSLSFFVTPALLGGANNMTIPMLIDTFVNERLAWPLAGAASMLLLGLVLGCIAVIGRFVPLGGLAEAR